MPNEERGGDHPVGIFEGFEGYRTISTAEYVEALGKGLVAVDANVLLNLYRYDDSSRGELLKILGALGDRLFVPHQVMLEFWRNREQALRDRWNTAQSTISRLKEVGETARSTVGEWANRLAVSEDARANLLDPLREAFEQVEEAVEASAGDVEEAERRDTSRDPVVRGLEQMLMGNVGPPYGPKDYENALIEGRRRIDMKVPPGYKDVDKPGDDALGDYLVWDETLLEAKKRGVEQLVFVTGDVKDDWWRRERGQLRGPRIELYNEARLRGSVELFMLRPTSLVSHAREALNLEIEADTVFKIGRAEDTSETKAAVSWTPDAFHYLLQKLQRQAPVQHDVMMEAISNGGFVSRDDVYDIAGYDEDRTLRGFTRPTKRIMEQMQDQGLLAVGVTEPLRAIYSSSESYVLASGFQVANDLVELAESLDDDS